MSIKDFYDLGSPPRARGHLSAESEQQISPGSPPRARGARLWCLCRCHRDRITPACAGSTSGLREVAQQRVDHPRVRGEHLTPCALRIATSGSPPRARGAPDSHRRLRVQGRITPACAGSTSTRTCCRSSHWDHPRVRGEHSIVHPPCERFPGSPPRARGARLPLRQRHFGDRITPACAGSTRGLRLRPTSRRDHPRVRGEHIASDSTPM